jgi:hypothetical protein
MTATHLLFRFREQTVVGEWTEEDMTGRGEHVSAWLQENIPGEDERFHL